MSFPLKFPRSATERLIVPLKWQCWWILTRRRHSFHPHMISPFTSPEGIRCTELPPPNTSAPQPIRRRRRGRAGAALLAALRCGDQSLPTNGSPAWGGLDAWTSGPRTGWLWGREADLGRLLTMSHL